MRHYWFFDLDGTLADTDRDIRESWKAALRDLGLECPDFDEKFVAGPPIEEMAHTLFPEKFTPAFAAALRAGFARHYDRDGFPNTHEYPGVLEAVRELKRRGDYAAIVTNKRFVGATAMSRHFGWDRLFDGLYAGDMYAETPIGRLRKGALLSRLLSELAVPKDVCTMVGDTISDFEAARENGLRSIAVAWGYGKAEERALSDVCISTPAELIECRSF